MSTFLLVLFASQCVYLVLWGMLRKGRIVELPFLAGCTLSGFALPQFIRLLSDPTLPPGGLEKTLLMANLCTAALYLGYTRCRRPLRAMNWHFDGNALGVVALALTATGAFFFFLISRLPEEMTNQSRWSGLPVAYLFFAQVLPYGFALSLLLWGQFRSRLFLLSAGFAAIFYLDRILIAARRGVASEFVLVLLCGLWFTRRWCPPRWSMLVFAFAAILFVNSAAEIRSVTMQGTAFGSIFQNRTPIPVGDLANVRYLENLTANRDASSYELRNAVFEMTAADALLSFDLGMFQWNRLVSRYVPAQLFGEDFKNSLMADTRDLSYSYYGYSMHEGTTITGFTDTFRSFWYLGCLVFFLIGYLMAKFYGAALEGHLVARLLYMLMATNVLLSITHATDWFFGAWPHALIFLFPALLLCRTRKLPFPAVLPEPETEPSPG